MLAIELDDGSHDTPERAAADKTKSRALTAARVPLVRWRTTALPDVETIRASALGSDDLDGDQLDVSCIGRGWRGATTIS